MRQFALIENIQREELNAVELAEAYGELIKLHDYTHEELSAVIHKSRVHITNTLRLLQLSSKTQKAVVEKKITAGHAKVLVGLDEKDQQLIVNSIVGQKLSVRDVEVLIKSRKEPEATVKTKHSSSIYNFENLEQKLQSIGFKYKLVQNKLTLDFSSQEEIDDFLKHIKDK